MIFKDALNQQIVDCRGGRSDQLIAIQEQLIMCHIFQIRVVCTKFDIYVCVAIIISPRWYHPPSSQYLGTDMEY